MCVGWDFSFPDELYENCILYVPEENIEEYKNAPIWSNFKNIEIIQLPEPDGEEKTCDIHFFDQNGVQKTHHSTTIITLLQPEEIQGYVFSKWVVIGGDLENGIQIQPVYVEEVNTSVEEVGVETHDNPQKVIKKGQIYIFKDGKPYNLSGVEIK